MNLKKTGRLISKKRKKLQLTQEQLSNLLTVTPQAVSLWERGKRYPDPEAQVRIFYVLGLNPVELLTGIEMFDNDLKQDIASYMERIDEEVFIAGIATDMKGNKEYLDLSGFSVVSSSRNGTLDGPWIPYTDYYNVEKPES